MLERCARFDLWQYFRICSKLGLCKPDLMSQQQFTNDDGTTMTIDERGRLIANHFTNIVSPRIEHTTEFIRGLTDMRSSVSFNDHQRDNRWSLLLYPIFDDEVSDMIADISGHTSPGPDTINMNVWKRLKIIPGFLSELGERFSEIMRTGEVPLHWRKCFLALIPKKDNPKSASES